MRKVKVGSLVLACVLVCAMTMVLGPEVATAATKAAGNSAVVYTFDDSGDATALPDGSGDTCPFVVVGTATGYDITSSVGDWCTGGIDLPSAVDLPPGDFTYTITINTDPTADLGAAAPSWGYSAVALSADIGSRGFSIAWEQHADIAAGVNIVAGYVDGTGDAYTGDDAGDIHVVDAGALGGTPMILRFVRAGNTLTADYTTPGTATFVNLYTVDLTNHVADGDISADLMSFGLWGWSGTSTYDVDQVMLDLAATPATPANLVGITRDDAADHPFEVDGTANWTVTFDEEVSGVDAGDFAAVLNSATVGAGPIVTDLGGGTSYNVEFTGVSTPDQGSIGLTFTPVGVTTVAGGVAVTVGGSASSSYSNFSAASAANTWMLIILTLTLVVGAAIVMRKKAMQQ